MTERPLTREEQEDVLAAEYVLGVLDAADRAAADHRQRTDRSFAGRVAAWEAQLSAMNDDFAEVPAPNLMPAIEARLFGDKTARSSGAGWWARFVAGAGFAGVMAVLMLAVLPPPVPVAPPVLTATLKTEGQPLAFAARYDPAAGELVVTRTGGDAAPAGAAHELWLIAGEAAPVSLGLFDAADLRRPLPALPAGASLAVSLEPAGGSPTGAPTGPVLASGVFGGT